MLFISSNTLNLFFSYSVKAFLFLWLLEFCEVVFLSTCVFVSILFLQLYSDVASYQFMITACVRSSQCLCIQDDVLCCFDINTWAIWFSVLPSGKIQVICTLVCGEILCLLLPSCLSRIHLKAEFYNVLKLHLNTGILLAMI